MIWDAGALSKYRYNSPIYRYLSNNPPRSNTWPPAWYEEFGIFLATPGVSWRWVQHNFNIQNGDRLFRVFHGTKHLHEARVWENIKSVTHDDALMYVQNKPAGPSNIPFWARPFILDDVKAGLGRAATARKWQISQYAINSMRQEIIGDVFHSRSKQGLRGHLGR